MNCRKVRKANKINFADCRVPADYLRNLAFEEDKNQIRD